LMQGIDYARAGRGIFRLMRSNEDCHGAAPKIDNLLRCRYVTF
jgi:hypothetical protein